MSNKNHDLGTMRVVAARECLDAADRLERAASRLSPSRMGRPNFEPLLKGPTAHALGVVLMNCSGVAYALRVIAYHLNPDAYLDDEPRKES